MDGHCDLYSKATQFTFCKVATALEFTYNNNKNYIDIYAYILNIDVDSLKL